MSEAKNEITGLSDKDVEEQIQKGNINKLPKDNLKTNKQIIFDNVFTLFNLYNFIIALFLNKREESFLLSLFHR